MNMHETLIALYDDMMPLCSTMSQIARALAGIGAMVNISMRIWRTLADGAQIEILPLMKPLGIGLLIAFFPTLVLGSMNGILGTIASGTEKMVGDETFSVIEFKKQREELERKRFAENPDRAYLENDEAFDKELESMGWSPADMLHMTNMFYQRAKYSVKLELREWMSEIMQLVFDSSSLIIDIIRTFYLVVLSVLGPISFSLSIWNGLESTLWFWVSRYIQIYLWLPVSNIFSCILARLETLILQSDIEALSTGEAESGTWVYLLFLTIGTVGYFCVPTVSQWIVQAGGVGSFNQMLQSGAKATAMYPYNTISQGVKEYKNLRKNGTN